MRNEEQKKPRLHPLRDVAHSFDHDAPCPRSDGNVRLLLPGFPEDYVAVLDQAEYVLRDLPDVLVGLHMLL